MPIPVTCPECQYHFLVGDEFAGRPGRCPECAAVIHVPGPGPEPPAADDPFPPRPPRPVDPFADDFPSRRRRDRAEERDRSDRDARDDYDDRPPDRAVERRFDPQARADAWSRVHRGLGYVQIAVVLYFFSQLLQTGFFFIRGGMERANDNALPDSGELAVGIGGLVVVLAAGAFWVAGRAAGTHVPYVPARSWARASFYLVLTAFAASLALFCSFGVAIGALVQQGPNPLSMILILLAFMLIFLAAVLVVGAEVTGLMSLAKIGDGLRSPSANWARHSLVLFTVLVGLLMFGCCGFVIYIGQKAKEKGQQANPAVNPKKDAGPPARANGPAKGNPPPAAPKGQPQPQQPNPFDDEPVDPKTQFVFQSVMIGLILLYLLHFSLTLQKSRRAIRAEVGRLTGTDERPNEHDGY